MAFWQGKTVKVETTKHLPDTATAGLPRSPLGRCKACLRTTLSSAWFAVILTIVNVGNCIMIGFETNCRVASLEASSMCSTEAETVFLVSEFVFLTLITLEFVMQIVSDWRYLCSAWGVFDIFIVAVSMFNAVAIQPQFLTNESRLKVGMDTLNAIPGLRIFRLFRLSRSLVKIIRFPELWIMVSGLLSALKSIAWIIILSALIVYIFAVLGVEMFSQVGGGHNALGGQAWSQVGEAMTTLLQIATLDEWASVTRPIRDEFPIAANIFVLVFMVIVAFTLMSLITVTLTVRTLVEAHREPDTKGQADNYQNAQERLLKEFAPTGMTKSELVEVWESRPPKVSPTARADLETFGTLEELIALFDLMTGGDVAYGELKPRHYFSFVTAYRQDKTASLSSLTLEHLRIVRRRVLCLEHLLEESTSQHTELLAPAGRRCAEVSARLREAQETSKCRDDGLREKRLSRAGLPTGDVTKLRHIFEVADTARRGELDFEDFSALFPRAAPHLNRPVVSEMWTAAVADHSSTIDFDEFLNIVVSNGANHLIRSALRIQIPRPAVCTAGDAEEDAKGLATQAAEMAAGRLAERVAEQVAEHAEQYAERVSKCDTKSTTDGTQLTVDLLKADMTDMVDRLSQLAAENLNKVGKDILGEWQESASSMADQQAKSFEALCQTLQENSIGMVEPQTVRHNSSGAESMLQELEHRARPTPLDGLDSVKSALSSSQPAPNKLTFEPYPTVSMSGSLQGLAPLPSPQGLAPLPMPAGMNSLRHAVTPQHGAGSVFDAGTPIAGDALRATFAGTPSAAQASRRGSFDTAVQSPSSGPRTCLLTQTENLARQVTQLVSPHDRARSATR